MGFVCRAAKFVDEGGSRITSVSSQKPLIFSGQDDYNYSVWDTLHPEKAPSLGSAGLHHENRVSCGGIPDRAVCAPELGYVHEDLGVGRQVCKLRLNLPLFKKTSLFNTMLEFDSLKPKLLGLCPNFPCTAQTHRRDNSKGGFYGYTAL